MIHVNVTIKQWLVIKHTVVPLYNLHANKVAIETGFPCIPTIYESEGGGEGALVWYYGLGGGRLFGGGRLLERGRLFEEIRYA